MSPTGVHLETKHGIDIL